MLKFTFFSEHFKDFTSVMTQNYIRRQFMNNLGGKRCINNLIEWPRADEEFLEMLNKIGN